MPDVDTAILQWQEGQRRLREADPADRAALERVSNRILDELRRRLGGPFTARELADLYLRGTDWCLDVAVTTVPNNPRAWDSRAAADSAFARYLREAADYGGGRRVGDED
jgi:hypothetical protein